MSWLELIREVGNADLVKMYLAGQINYSELAEEIGNSNAGLVNDYKYSKESR